MVPTPKYPAFVNLPASVRAPAFSTENAKSPFPPVKFCWSIDVMEAVEVPVLFVKSCALNVRRDAVDVALARLVK